MAETAEILALLAAVRNYLDITWTDETLDSKLVTLIKAGKAYLNGISGTVNDYTVEGQALSLLLDYVRYARSGATEMYWQNYRHELMSLNIERGVDTYAAEIEAD